MCPKTDKRSLLLLIKCCLSPYKFKLPNFSLYIQLATLNDLGWPGVISLTWNESVPWEVMPEVFKCSVQGGGLKWGGASFLEQNTWIPQA